METVSQNLAFFLKESFTRSHQSSPFYFLLNLVGFITADWPFGCGQRRPDHWCLRGSWISGDGLTKARFWGMTSVLCKSVRFNEVFMESIKFCRIVFQLVQFMDIRKVETSEFDNTQLSILN